MQAFEAFGQDGAGSRVRALAGGPPSQRFMFRLLARDMEMAVLLFELHESGKKRLPSGIKGCLWPRKGLHWHRLV